MFYRVPEANCLQISGEDRVAFLQRQTTNDVRKLAADGCLTTVLTSPTARILDVLTLIQEGDSILAFTLPGHGAKTANFLKSRIFFMDKVVLNDVSAEYLQALIIGEDAQVGLGRFGLESPPEVGQLARAAINGTGCLLVMEAGFPIPAYRLIAPASAEQELLKQLTGAGMAEIAPADYEVLRIELGIPGAGAELSEAYTPLEVGLANAVSDSKGCYTGQEVIARQITYDKVSRQLAGLRLDGAAAPGDKVYAAKAPVGEVTSAVHSTRYGWIALAVLKRPHHTPGSALCVHGSEGEVAAQAVEIPFKDVLL